MAPTTPIIAPVVSPPTYAANAVELRTKTESKIQNVSLYSSQAEIARLYRFDVVSGLNQVNIIGLPNTMQKESIRVEGKGSATIHDVTVSMPPPPAVATTSDALKELTEKKERNYLALQRTHHAISSLHTYLNTFDTNLLGEQLENYEAVAEKLDERVLKLKKDQADIDRQIVAEELRLKEGTIEEDAKTRMKVGVGVLAEAAGTVELVLIYVVTCASWTAAYDVRVSMDTKENPMVILYKAVVSHNTGEDWTDIPLTLETASPSYGIEIPTLDPWKISLHSPGMHRMRKSRGLSVGGSMSIAPQSSSPMPRMILQNEYDPTIEDSYSPMEYREVAVTSQGNVNATFTVPGLVSVPSDGEAHTFTIATLDLQAELSWVAVPNKDAKVHLKAKVLNSSMYTLLSGTASIYVDGSFISKSNMPSVSPQEKFDYSLGLDPSIRITYHPRSSTLSQSGFYNKTSTSVYTQRITVHNTKNIRVDNIKVIDQIPISEHSDIVVKLDTPALPAVLPAGTLNSKLKSGGNAKDMVAPVKLGGGVMAQWEVDGDVEAEPGRDGKISWTCSVSPQEKVNMVLKWDVTSPARSHVYGL